MKKHLRILLAALCLVCLLLPLAGCGGQAGETGAAELPVAEPAPEEETGAVDVSGVDTTRVAGAGDMAEPVELDLEGLTPRGSEGLRDGVYDIAVDSSSSMFRIAECRLGIVGGNMYAALTIDSSSYLWLYPGTAEEAAAADPGEYLAPEEQADGSNVFTIPVAALDAPVSCAAFSRNKEMWYDRTLVFRSASLPTAAFVVPPYTDPAKLELADGTYTVEVVLSGGSGRASVTSPAELTVTEGAVTAVVEWSSANYDYMLVDGAEYLPLPGEGNSRFEIPVRYFDYPLSVQADTTAMSQPYLIDYSLTFLSDTLTPAAESPADDGA